MKNTKIAEYQLNKLFGLPPAEIQCVMETIPITSFEMICDHVFAYLNPNVSNETRERINYIHPRQFPRGLSLIGYMAKQLVLKINTELDELCGPKTITSATAVRCLGLFNNKKHKH
jgi:hypothetical protein